MASNHVFIVPSGFGKRVIPIGTPYSCWVGSDNSLSVEFEGSRMLFPSTMGIAEFLEQESAIADIIEGPNLEQWWLDARAFQVPMQPGWTVQIPEDSLECLFLGENDVLVSVQRCHKLPPNEQLLVERQHVVNSGVGGFPNISWVQVGYEYENREWGQKLMVRRESNELSILVIAQAPLEFLERTSELQGQLIIQTILVA